MKLEDFLKNLDYEVNAVMSSDFQIEITDTDFVPAFDDSSITYDNLDRKTKKCKRLETCVLYVDMRDSTKISAAKKPITLARIYSVFIKSMIEAAKYNDGYVRNIIGDRVMVVFHRKDCFIKAINTAILMNTISNYILNKRIKTIDFRCGIGIDYGTMLVTKVGMIKRGSETEFYRSLVWLGKPANIASKLTDIANKTTTTTLKKILQMNYNPTLDKWLCRNRSYESFINDLKTTSPPYLIHKNPHFQAFYKRTQKLETTPSPILMTQAVYEGLKREHPDEDTIVNNYWEEQSVKAKDYDGKIFGGDVFYQNRAR